MILYYLMRHLLPVLFLASSAERGSEHPLGQAVAKEPGISRIRFSPFSEYI